MPPNKVAHTSTVDQRFGKDMSKIPVFIPHIYKDVSTLGNVVGAVG